VRLTVITLALLFAGSAGCAGPAFEPPGAYAPCLPSSWCQVTEEPDGTRTFVLEGLEVQGSDPAYSAVQLQPERPGDRVVLRDSTIHAAGDGIRVGGRCDGCRIEIENSTILGAGGAHGIDARGLSSDSPITLVLRGVRIEGFDAAVSGPPDRWLDMRQEATLEAEDTLVACQRVGIEGLFASVALSRVDVGGCSGEAVHVEVERESSVAGSSLHGSHVGLHVEGEGRVRVDGSSFVGNRLAGLRAMGPGAIEVEASRFEGNGHEDPNGGFGALVYTDGFVHASVFQANRHGLASPYPGFDATDNYWGSRTGPVVATGTPADEATPADTVSAGTVFVPFRERP
jgi:hypothetical protein